MWDELGFNHAASFNTVISAEHPGDGLRVNAVLFGQDTRRELLKRVIVFNRDGRLEQDRAAVEIFVYEMNGAAGDLYAVGESLVLGIEAWKGREERGVDIENAPAKLRNEPTAQKPHVACETNPINTVLLQQISNLRIELGPLDAF
jgi:hypothetical protein